MVYRRYRRKFRKKSNSIPKTITKRKTYRKKTRFMSNYPRINMSLNPAAPFGKKICRSLAYSSYFSLDAAAGGVNSVQFRCNSLYDPDYTSTGHQPRGFDQIMASFQFYTVIGSRIRIRPISGAGSGSATQLLLACSDSLTPYSNETDVTTYSENMSVVDKLWLTDNTNNAGTHKNILSNRWSAKKFYNTPTVMAGTDYRGSASSNPAENALWTVTAIGYAGNDAPVIYCTVEIEYIAVFDEPIPVGSS